MRSLIRLLISAFPRRKSESVDGGIPKSVSYTHLDVYKRQHQVRLTETALADHHHWTTLVRANGLDPFQEIVGGLGDRQELLRCDLGRAGVRFVGELNGCPFEAFSPKFFS